MGEATKKTIKHSKRARKRPTGHIVKQRKIRINMTCMSWRSRLFVGANGGYQWVRKDALGPTGMVGRENEARGDMNRRLGTYNSE